MNEPEQESVVTVERELTALSRRLRNGARGIYAANGLTFTEYSLLRMVDDHPGTNAAELANAAMIDKSTASRQLGGLRDRGLLARVADGRSARGQRLELTDLARTTLRDIASASEAAISALLVDWPADDVAMFAALLHRYNSAATRGKS
ncbi:MarR family transcriptional regulator [Gordonia sp. PDNC005]|uniref:MarR family winged helix-turn-helix transcriptional regulator n=1 Tax=unclassified Gordonia (in: high G+C Gram-positive bacteria) TaxID=2657482 RepID=UPI001964FB51|nr:MarR family transcriptional regulator [Gordonia sp. PDNC005]QRY63748.1 MarR family transcriptional regulator [Gordonia sp. PDNC005]